MQSRTCAAVAALCVLASGGAFAAEPDFKPSADAIRGHMSFLASDLLEGREAGTRGYDIAASYVAARFTELGLKPAGQGGSFVQPVPLVGYRPAAAGSLSVVNARGAATPLILGDDYLPSATPEASEVKLDAPLVFVGFGIVAPERGRDDYAGLDVKGKVVVVLSGAPKSFQSEERAFYGGRRLKQTFAAEHGAAGIIFAYTPTYEKVSPFEKSRNRWQTWSVTWRGADGKAYYPGGRTLPAGSVSLKGAAKLLAGAPGGVDAVMAAAESEAGDPPRFALPGKVRVNFRNESKPLQSSNVAGMIEGSDPRLKNEVVVLSAHLDHIGITAPVNGDSINNGAMDNAAGIATMLEAARGFAEAGKAPRRSVMFLAVTAEEKGLIGAEYFAHQPTVARERIVADVNLDMPILTYDFTDVIAFGADRSSIGPVVRRAGASMGVSLTPDPAPDQGIFVRSDHFRFVEQGIPSVFLGTGVNNGGREAAEAFEKTRYHQPSDDLQQGVRYDAGAKFAALNYAIARELADADARPVWNDGDFFGTRFGGTKSGR